MANGTKNAIIQKKIDGIIYDLMIKTNTANVICDDGVTLLSTKIASLVTDIATKSTSADVDARIQQVIGAAPEALNTLEELANALNDDAGFAATLSSQLTALTTSVNSKVDCVAGKQLSTEDFTTLLKTKLDGLSAYVHPSNHPATMIVEDGAHRFATDTEKVAWNNKVDKVTGFGLSTNDYTAAEKTKLSGIATGATNYTHPSTHPATMIVEDVAHRFAMDTEKATWNNKVDKVTGFGLSTNDYTSAEKTKLSGIATGATNYVHPSTHPATMIVEDMAHRYATDAEKVAWNGKARVIAAATAPSDLTENDLFIQILN